MTLQYTAYDFDLAYAEAASPPPTPLHVLTPPRGSPASAHDTTPYQSPDTADVWCDQPPMRRSSLEEAWGCVGPAAWVQASRAFGVQASGQSGAVGEASAAFASMQLSPSPVASISMPPASGAGQALKPEWLHTVVKVGDPSDASAACAPVDIDAAPPGSPFAADVAAATRGNAKRPHVDDACAPGDEPVHKRSRHRATCLPDAASSLASPGERKPHDTVGLKMA